MVPPAMRPTRKQAQSSAPKLTEITVPSRTRVDKVEALMRQLSIPMDVPYQRAASLALLVPDIHTVSDDLYARTVLCAVSLIMPAAVPLDWVCKLPTATILRESIMSWALLIADVAARAQAPTQEQWGCVRLLDLADHQIPAYHGEDIATLTVCPDCQPGVHLLRTT
jgi:hypothetical protein